MSEAELIKAAQKGDEQAFEVLVSQHQQAIFRFAYLLLRDYDDAQDVAQETLSDVAEQELVPFSW